MDRCMLVLMLCVAFTGCATTPAGGQRIDGSSAASAEASWKRMLDQAAPRERMALLTAMVEINLQGVETAYDVAGNKDLHKLSISRIRDKVDGMTAGELLEYADEVSTVDIELEVSPR